MRKYHQLTSGERYELSALRKQGFSQRGIARALNRAPSTISREVRRNAKSDGWYRPGDAHDYARWRRAAPEGTNSSAGRSGRWSSRFSRSTGARSRSRDGSSGPGVLSISYETIYRYVWDDRACGGTLYDHLRQRAKQRRKRYRSYDSRGKLAGKRAISERPPGAENRSRVGHFEGDTVMGSSKDKHCLLTLVDRKTGYVLIGKLENRTVEETNRKAIELIQTAGRTVRTVTVDHGTEFHGYKSIEAATGARFYFATPYHSWERGTSENTNGLIRQYFPKGQSVAHVSQADCNAVASELNSRPRKRLGYLTPEECYEIN